MSFSAKVRDELLSKLSAYRWNETAALTALSSFAVVSLKSRKSKNIVMRVSRDETARLISDLAEHINAKTKILSKGKRDQQIELDLNGREWEVVNFDFYALIKTRPQSDWWIILAPLFLAAGFMSDPSNRIYHLEITPVLAEQHELLHDLLHAMELPFRKTRTKGRPGVYL
ncbi:MAG: hypothetical protein PHV73_06250, partial [Eubacteriales bacterium]|nr:hypothetical protein [Eubacteriales bacterium]